MTAAKKTKTKPKKRKHAGPRIVAEAPATWLVVAASASTLNQHRGALNDLVRARHAVRIAYGGGKIGNNLPKATHRLLTQRRVAGVPTLLLSQAVTAPVPIAQRLRLAGHDRWLRHTASRADQILLLDQGIESPIYRTLSELAPQARMWLPDEVNQALVQEAAWRRLIFEARALDALPDSQPRQLSGVLVPARRLLEAREERGISAADARIQPSSDIRPELRRLARWALRRGRLSEAQELIDATSLLTPYFAEKHDVDAPLRVLQAHLDLVHGRDPEGEVVDLAAEVLNVADAALSDGDLREAAELGSVAYALLFHQQLHTAVESTPLVTMPSQFLAAMRNSRLGRVLATTPPPEHTVGGQTYDDESGERAEATPSPTPEESLDEELPSTTPRALRVTMLPGAYSNHAVPLVEALREDPRAELTVLQPATRAFGGLMIDTPIIQHRLEHALGLRPTVDLGVEPDEVAAVRDADVVVADWADKGCVWASTVVRPESRFIVRVHSVDALSAPAHLVDWGRVDDLIFVSEHIRDVFSSILGDRLDHIRKHVVTNIVPLQKFSAPLLPDATRTLGMVGWAQVVKDPAFALDILELLVQDDPSWRLRLIGADFGSHHAAHAQRYAEEFRQRALSANLVDHIDYVGFTTDLPEHLRHVGYILSTSLRESCPVGALEGTAAGAFPVVREWPAFSPYEGAKRLFPAANVVNTPAEAADLIRRVANEADRRAAVAHVHEQMADRFSEAETQARLLDIVLANSA